MNTFTAIILCLVLFNAAMSLEVFEKRIYVAQNKADCVGTVPMRCFLVKMAPNDRWEFHFDNIDNFNYDEGFQYELLVEEKKHDRPVADRPSFTWSLRKIIQKNRVHEIAEVGHH
ncbi:unnamed protein product [Didymodactylos carnosus]|uniref:DUF4377 domain-containing protein n=1 Tax=Didymodactylos carnosus TaxID=1234261 RepID=A0A815UUV5_9BILA|nr:unnamed protein product [Didymodactylos carnosus]CAF1522065.1 unnamed protein product [Didymodactylos carnosus]CAF4051053.1 unnamed protein product [Didymodactylos carnosus]CAF4381237.1 unnamed protein product [Didymodactylos carnosus]